MKPIIELLTFAGCPNAEPTLRLVERVVDELGADVEVRRLEVVDARAAVENRFLGSPTVRVNGRDVEPGAEGRTDFAWSCRVYSTEAGVRGRPNRQWIRAALLSAE